MQTQSFQPITWLLPANTIKQQQQPTYNTNNLNHSYK